MSDIDTAAADSLKVLDPERPIREVDIGFAIGSIVRLQVCKVRMANGWALGKFARKFAAARRLRWAAPIWSIFCEPTFVHSFTCPFVMLWTAPPPARGCHGYGCC